MVKKNGVRVISAKENITDDASGILVEGILESMAEYYSVRGKEFNKNSLHRLLRNKRYIYPGILYTDEVCVI